MNIDNEINSEILPYVKYFENLPNSIQNQATEKANSLTPQQYFVELSNAWNNHNEIAHEIDYYLYALFSKRTTIEQNLYKTSRLISLAFDTEEAKRVLSAGAKHALDKYELEMEGKLSEDEILLVLTPQQNFWSSVYYDHINFLFAKCVNAQKAFEVKTQIINKYHANCEVVFNQRLSSNFSKESQWNADKLKDVLETYKGRKNTDLVASLKLIFLRYPDAKQINNLVSYDNYEEYLFGYNYYGYPDFLLRKTIISYLIDKNVLDKRDSILMYSKLELLSALKMIDPANSHFGRTDNEPETYLQTTPTTCGVACMMMGLNFFIGTPLTKSLESKLRKKLKLKRFDIVPAMNLAIYIQKLGFDVRIYHQDAFKFWNFIKERNQDIYEQQNDILAFAGKRGLKPIDKEISPRILKDLINQGYLILMGIELSYDIKHAILLYAIDDNTFSAIDPLSGERKYSENELMRQSDMNTGRWFIAFNYKDSSLINNH